MTWPKPAILLNEPSRLRKRDDRINRDGMGKPYQAQNPSRGRNALGARITAR